MSRTALSARLCCALLALMLLAAAACAGADAAADDAGVAAADGFARGSIPYMTATDSDAVRSEYRLRAAFRFDVAAAREALAASAHLDAFEEAYGQCEKVYVLEYACMTGGALPVSQYVAVGADGEGNWSQVLAPDQITARNYAPGWYADVDMELVYDATLAEILAE